ncbi:MAG: sugar phosphate isomerase/epimerase [Clostridia bacterium]|nr:sugar phosphate isomerase/epimerase [Clostridia bacterium]
MQRTPLYCSTGTIIGRVTGYDYRKILEYMPRIAEAVSLDGVELMMLGAYLERTVSIARALKASGLCFPIIHADKEIGTLLSHAAVSSDNETALRRQALCIWSRNCEMGEIIGARQIVIHLWGGSDSDANLESNLRCLEDLCETAALHGLEVLIENVPCTTADPIRNLSQIHAAFPDQRFVFDTRFAAFHNQLESLTETPWLIGNRLAHMHISDLHPGAPRDFSRLRPILHPGEGMIDFPALIGALKKRDYAGSVTMESPVMSEAGIDSEKMIASLRQLRAWLDGKE